MTPGVAASILWVTWFVTWIGAGVWSAKTRTQLKTDRFGPHRWAVGLGALLLFCPALPPPATLLTTQLWRAPLTITWSLFALVVASFGFCWWARLHLGRLWSGFVTLKQDHRVVDSGPYGLVRHPIYSGVMAAALSTAMIRATPAGLAGFVLITVGFRATAAIEEGFLRAQLGAEAYDAYSRSVGRLLPGLGRLR